MVKLLNLVNLNHSVCERSEFDLDLIQQEIPVSKLASDELLDNHLHNMFHESYIQEVEVNALQSMNHHCCFLNLHRSTSKKQVLNT